MIFGRSTRKTHINTELRVFLGIHDFRNAIFKMYYKTKLKFNIMLFVVRPRPSNKRFRSTKIDFFDSGKKLRTDPKLEEPKLARNEKNKNLISFGNIRQHAAFRHGFGRCLRRFCLIFSINIENLFFLPRANSKRSTTGRFEEKCAPRKTL